MAGMLQGCQMASSSSSCRGFPFDPFYLSELLPLQTHKGKAIPVLLSLHRSARVNAAQGALKLHFSALSSLECLSGIVIPRAC